MTRTDEEVVQIILDLYNEEFAGKKRQRYLISWADIRTLYGFRRLEMSRRGRFTETAGQRGLYVFDLDEGEMGHMVAIAKMRTVHRWRRVPKRLIDRYRLPPDDDSESDEDDSD